MFLQGAGGVAVGLPLLEATSGRAWAQGQGPKRFIVFMTHQGLVKNAWRPSGSTNNWQLSEILQPLAPFKSKLNVIDRLDNKVNRANSRSNGHDSAARTLLTCEPFAANVASNGDILPSGSQVSNGYANGPSLDQVIATKMNVNTRFKSLDLGIGGRGDFSTQLLHAGPNDPITLNDDPRDLFNRLFSNLPPPGSTASPPPPPPAPTVTTLERIQARRGSVLDAVRDSFARVRGNLGSVDRARLDAHAEKIRTLEERFPNVPISQMREVPVTPGGGCEQPILPAFPNNYAPGTAYHDNITAQTMIDQLVMALTCDMTRVGTLQFVQYHDPTFPWLNVSVPGGFTNWHAMIHEALNTPSRATLIRVMTWYAEMFAYLLQQMDSIPEGDGTMLDNSLVLWLTEFGNGAVHGTWDMSFVTAGSAGGTVPTNRYLQDRDRSHCDLYTAILNAFGFPDRVFGRAEFNNGPLAGFVG